MLTVQDLQNIGNLIDERLDIKLEEKLESKLEEKLESKLEEKLESKLEEKISPIRKDIKKMKNDLGAVIKHFDQDWYDHEKRIQRLEKLSNLNYSN